MAGRLTGTVVGSATSPNLAGCTLITIRINPPSVIDQLAINTPSSSIVGQLTIGLQVSIYVAFNSTEQTAIEGAVTATPFETND